MDGERGLFTGGEDNGGGGDDEDVTLPIGNNDIGGGCAWAGWYWEGSCVVLQIEKEKKIENEIAW